MKSIEFRLNLAIIYNKPGVWLEVGHWWYTAANVVRILPLTATHFHSNPCKRQEWLLLTLIGPSWHLLQKFLKPLMLALVLGLGNVSAVVKQWPAALTCNLQFAPSTRTPPLDEVHYNSTGRKPLSNALTKKWRGSKGFSKGWDKKKETE